jgi:hypothetical protein
MNYEFLRGTFHNIRFVDWVLGIVVVMLLFMEPDSWYTVEPTSGTKTSTPPATQSKPAAGTPASTSTSASPPKTNRRQK